MGNVDWRKLWMTSASFGVALTLMACQVVGDAPLERPEIPAWRASMGMADATPAPAHDAYSPASVWHGTGNAELLQFIDAGKTLNTDVQAALQRVAQARAIRTGSGAEAWPQVEANVHATRSRQEGADTTGGQQQAGIGLTYEIDLWQRVANAAEASRYREFGSHWDQIAVEQSITAAIVEDYASVLALRERIRIASDSLILLKDVLAVVVARVDAGAATALELSQQRTEVSRAEAALLALQQQERTRQHSLAVLTGNMPQTLEIKGMQVKEVALPALSVLPPESLLQRRPDILALEATLEAARLDIAVARAALYPSAQIGADLALTKNPYNAPAEWIGSVFGALSAPLFDGGALRAEVELAQARHGELLAQYRGVVLQACSEVEDALVARHTAEQRLAHLDDARRASQQAFQLARERFAAGAIDFQTLLDTQRSVLTAEDEQVQAQLALVLAGVQWVRAFAGG